MNGMVATISQQDAQLMAANLGMTEGGVGLSTLAGFLRQTPDSAQAHMRIFYDTGLIAANATFTHFVLTPVGTRFLFRHRLSGDLASFITLAESHRHR